MPSNPSAIQDHEGTIQITYHFGLLEPDQVNTP